MNLKEKETVYIFLKLFDDIKIPFSWYSLLPLCYAVSECVLIAQCEVHKRITCLNIILSIIF